MNLKKIIAIFKRFKKNNPQPTTELKFNNNFELLIAVMLSAQATDVSVNKVTPTLFHAADTPAAMLTLGIENLSKIISSIGLYNTKAKNIMAACKILVEKYQSQVPERREDLESLPGVGRKTANVVLNTAFNQPVIAVDTHLFRVANRIGLTHAKNPLETETQLYENIPEEFLQNTHHWLILHGRYICVARKPKCSTCFINDLCEYPDKTLS